MAARSFALPLLLCSTSSSHRATLLAPPACPYRAAARPMVSPGFSPHAPPSRCGAQGPGPHHFARPSVAAAAARYPRVMGRARACCFRRRCGAPRPPTYCSSSSHTPRATRCGLSRKPRSLTSLACRSTSSSSCPCSIPCRWSSPARIPRASPSKELTYSRRDRYKGSLDVLWGFQMFLTNTLLIPYMAIRLSDPDKDQSPPQTSQLGSVMVRGASVVGITGGLVCVLSIVWALFGRADADFGGTLERWQFVQSYVLSERLAYAFLWDILLYSIFQPWLIGDNLQNVKANATEFVNVVRFLPVVGLIAYLLCLEEKKD